MTARLVLPPLPPEPSVALIIPALDEAGNIGRLVAAIPALPGRRLRVIVVDNGSRDATADEAAAAGAQVIREPRRGYGRACAAGTAAARGHDVLVYLDGDGSFAPAELPRLLGPLAAGADLVLGARRLDHGASGAMPAHQRFGNRLAAALLRRLYGVALSDLGPYRAVRAALVERLALREMTYGWPTEMIVKAARLGARIVEVPVSCRPRGAGRSKVSGTLRGTVLAAVHIVGTALRYAAVPVDESSQWGRSEMR
jgi:glycosyltransferase involved in cell wall biosynthesis